MLRHAANELGSVAGAIRPTPRPTRSFSIETRFGTASPLLSSFCSYYSPWLLFRFSTSHQWGLA